MRNGVSLKIHEDIRRPSKKLKIMSKTNPLFFFCKTITTIYGDDQEEKPTDFCPHPKLAMY